MFLFINYILARDLFYAKLYSKETAMYIYDGSVNISISYATSTSKAKKFWFSQHSENRNMVKIRCGSGGTDVITVRNSNELVFTRESAAQDNNQYFTVVKMKEYKEGAMYVYAFRIHGMYLSYASDKLLLAEYNQSYSYQRFEFIHVEGKTEILPIALSNDVEVEIQESFGGSGGSSGGNGSGGSGGSGCSGGYLGYRSRGHGYLGYGRRHGHQRHLEKHMNSYSDDGMHSDVDHGHVDHYHGDYHMFGHAFNFGHRHIHNDSYNGSEGLYENGLSYSPDIYQNMYKNAYLYNADNLYQAYKSNNLANFSIEPIAKSYENAYSTNDDFEGKWNATMRIIMDNQNNNHSYAYHTDYSPYSYSYSTSYYS